MIIKNAVFKHPFTFSTPVYFINVTAQAKAVIDRSFAHRLGTASAAHCTQTNHVGVGLGREAIIHQTGKRAEPEEGTVNSLGIRAPGKVIHQGGPSGGGGKRSGVPLR